MKLEGRLRFRGTELGRASGLARSSPAMGLLGDSVSSTTVHRSVLCMGSLKYNLMAQLSIPGPSYAACQSAGQPAHVAGSRAGWHIWDDAAGSASQATEGQERLSPFAEGEKSRGRDKVLLSLWQLPGSCTTLTGGERKKGRGENKT